MKMPSMKTLAIGGAGIVVAIVVFSKLHASSSTSTTTASGATSSGSTPANSTGVDTGQLGSFETSLTSELDAWEAQQTAGGGSTSTSTGSSTPTATSSPIPSSGSVPQSNPAPVVTSKGVQVYDPATAKTLVASGLPLADNSAGTAQYTTATLDPIANVSAAQSDLSAGIPVYWKNPSGQLEQVTPGLSTVAGDRTLFTANA